MLPDFPKTKQLLSEAFHRRIKIALQRRLGIFSQIQPTQLHEGSKCLLHRNDGSSEENEMQRLEASAQGQHDVREPDSLSVDNIFEILDELGQNLAAEHMRLMIERLDKAVHDVGNVGDPKKPFLEQFFDLLEKQHVDFDEMGRPIHSQIIVGSQKAAETVKETFEKIENDPVLWKKYETLIEQKRLEWRDREAARNLVE